MAPSILPEVGLKTVQGQTGLGVPRPGGTSGRVPPTRRANCARGQWPSPPAGTTMTWSRVCARLVPPPESGRPVAPLHARPPSARQHGQPSSRRAPASRGDTLDPRVAVQTPGQPRHLAPGCRPPPALRQVVGDRFAGWSPGPPAALASVASLEDSRPQIKGFTSIRT